MSYTLISSERSPFGRICRMLMHAHTIPFQFRVLNFLDNKESAEALARETPINKVPILVIDENQKVFDSRVIANYLIQKHGLRPLTLNEENLVSAVYSCLDVSVILFLMKHNGYDLEARNVYLDRQKERIPRNLDFIEPWAARLDPRDPADWNYASMSLYSFLYWAHVRAGTVRLEDRPRLGEFVDRFAGAPGVKETVFPNS